MAATLANGGVNPITGCQALPRDRVRDVLAVMYTCGMYDFAGEWAYSVGVPAKSGVSGGVLAVIPGKMGVGVFSPGLDRFGNSWRRRPEPVGITSCAAGLPGYAAAAAMSPGSNPPAVRWSQIRDRRRPMPEAGKS